MKDIPPKSRWRDKSDSTTVLVLHTTPSGNGRSVVFRPDGEETPRSVSRTKFLEHHEQIEADTA